MNITAGGKVTNTANITVAGTLSITANNDSTRTDDPAGAFFYVSNRGNITATTLNIAAVDNFYNRGNVTADNFNITSAKSVFFLNEEIDSFVGYIKESSCWIIGSGGVVVCCNTQSTRHSNISCICYLSSCCDIQTIYRNITTC